MLPTVIVSLAATAFVATTALMPTGASAARPQPGTWNWPPYAEGGNMPRTTCGHVWVIPNLSRENVMRQATSLRDVTFPWLLPGITLNTSATDYQPLKMMRETRFNGKTWELLDDSN